MNSPAVPFVLAHSAAWRTRKENSSVRCESLRILSFKRKRWEETSLMFIVVLRLPPCTAIDTPYYIVSRTENIAEWTIRRYLC